MDLGGGYPESFPEEFEPENPAIYHPDQNKTLVKNEGETTPSKVLDKYQFTITNNNYITSRPQSVRKYQPPDLFLTDSEEISDYVGVPSPDSGIGMQLEIELLRRQLELP